MRDGFFHPALDSSLKGKPPNMFPISTSPRLPHTRVPQTAPHAPPRYRGNQSNGTWDCMNARVNDLRDQQRRRGVTPRDHPSINIKQIQTIQRAAAARKDAAARAEISRQHRMYKPNKVPRPPPPPPPPPPAPDPPWVPPGSYEATAHHVLVKGGWTGPPSLLRVSLIELC